MLGGWKGRHDGWRRSDGKRGSDDAKGGLGDA